MLRRETGRCSCAPRRVEALGLGLAQVELDAVAEQGGVAAEAHPARRLLGVDHARPPANSRSQRSWLPSSMDLRRAVAAVGQQMVEHLAALEAAVDADRPDARSARRWPRPCSRRSASISSSIAEQQVEPAVQVADGVDAHAARHRRRPARQPWARPAVPCATAGTGASACVAVPHGTPDMLTAVGTGAATLRHVASGRHMARNRPPRQRRAGRSRTRAVVMARRLNYQRNAVLEPCPNHQASELTASLSSSLRERRRSAGGRAPRGDAGARPAASVRDRIGGSMSNRRFHVDGRLLGA